MNAKSFKKQQMITRIIPNGPVCILTEQGRLYFSSAQCAEHVLSALLLNHRRRNR